MSRWTTVPSPLRNGVADPPAEAGFDTGWKVTVTGVALPVGGSSMLGDP